MNCYTLVLTAFDLLLGETGERCLRSHSTLPFIPSRLYTIKGGEACFLSLTRSRGGTHGGH